MQIPALLSALAPHTVYTAGMDSVDMGSATAAMDSPDTDFPGMDSAPAY